MPISTQPNASGRAPAGRLGYFKESQLPIYSAWLVLPFLLFYQIGIIIMPSNVINGGEAIVKKLGGMIVSSLGISGSLVSIIFIVAAFLIWQNRRKGKWQIYPPVLAVMCLESLIYALLLFQILSFFAQSVSPPPNRRAEVLPVPCGADAPPAELCRLEARTTRPTLPVPCASRSGNSSGVELRDFVLYCGAGVYEELVFRACLLGLLMLVMTRLMHMEHAYAAAWSVALGAFIFAAFHHVGDNGDKFEINVFLQRLICGLYFSALYYNRSFGVAAASHAMYDILIGLNRIG